MREITPLIFVAQVGDDSYQVDATGRFGGGFSGMRTNRQGVIAKLKLLARYDCDGEPARVIVPAELRDVFAAAFPRSFAGEAARV